jgi:hypothetical protein
MCPKKIEFIFSILNASGSIGTFGAFVFLFLKDKFKESQIDKLSSIIIALKEQNEITKDQLRLTFLPILGLSGTQYRAETNELRIDINNKGEMARIFDIKLISGDITLHSLSIPYDLEKDSSRLIFAKVKGVFSTCNYKIEVLYFDKMKNRYSVIIEGLGNNIKLIEEKTI